MRATKIGEEWPGFGGNTHGIRRLMISGSLVILYEPRLGQNKSVAAGESTLCWPVDRKAAGTPLSDGGGPLRKLT